MFCAMIGSANSTYSSVVSVPSSEVFQTFCFGRIVSVGAQWVWIAFRKMRDGSIEGSSSATLAHTASWNAFWKLTLSTDPVMKYSSPELIATTTFLSREWMPCAVRA